MIKHPLDTVDTAIYKKRSSIRRFLNPWVDLANVTTDDTLLSFKIENVTRTFGVVAALMCSLSAAAMAVTPSSGDEEEIIVSQEGVALSTWVASLPED